ncbi:MAG TPA: hypothetical protein VFM37_14980 [Pseudonocardiaceae bacterium]|nr:hypothetical protein [Pseudonocardiaceae bacterium]
MTPIVFIDTETTSLRPDRRAWEIALIHRGDHGERAHHWFIEIVDLDLGEADLFSLNIGGFYQRHPQMRVTDVPDQSLSTWTLVASEEDVMREVEVITRGAHLVGAVPNFDAEVLAARMRYHGIAPSWHYHLIDVEALAVGALARGGTPPALPWKSDELSRALGVEPPGDTDRHTALGDAQWARAIYDSFMFGQPQSPTPEGASA